MDPILPELRTLADTVDFKAPSVPILSPLLEDVVFDGNTIDARFVTRASREPVDFLGALKAAEDLEMIDTSTIWLEISSTPVCGRFIKSAIALKSDPMPTLRKGEDNWTTINSSLIKLYMAGVNIDWVALHRPFEKARRLLDLPKYSWNEKNYWIQYEGTWALHKGCQDPETIQQAASSSLRTSTIHEVLEEAYQRESASITIQSDLQHPEFWEAANGHRINNCAVVTSVSFPFHNEFSSGLITCSRFMRTWL